MMVHMEYRNLLKEKATQPLPQISIEEQKPVTECAEVTPPVDKLTVPSETHSAENTSKPKKSSSRKSRRKVRERKYSRMCVLTFPF